MNVSYRVLAGVVMAGQLMFISGCLNISARLQPEDLTVSASLYGEDCAAYFFGIGWGTVTIEAAMLAAGEPDLDTPKGKPMKKIRTVQLTDTAILGFGSRCIEVTGEP